jgi:hypothetical protein
MMSLIALPARADAHTTAASIPYATTITTITVSIITRVRTPFPLGVIILLIVVARSSRHHRLAMLIHHDVAILIRLEGEGAFFRGCWRTDRGNAALVDFM